MKIILKILTLAVLTNLLPISVTAVEEPLETDQNYRVQPGDVVRVTVFNEPDISIEAKVDLQGTVLLPLLGDAQMGGMNGRQIEGLLRQRYIDEDFLIDPQVSVAVVQYASRVFYIFGEVNNPGAKNFPPGRQSLDVLEAISLGGDLTQYAKRNDIVLRRPSHDGQSETRISINLDEILKGNRGRNATETVVILPRDIIFVPERLF